MGQRMADGGYAVLLPDLFYRSGPYVPMNPATVFGDPAKRAELMRLISGLDRTRKISDAGAFIEFLASRPEVSGDRFGVTGYCMGGNFALTAAGAYGERFAAVASFHGGHLATDQPDSPHRFVGNITGRVYVGGAVDDASFTPEQKERLEGALSAAGVSHLVEFYPGALHGFAVPDMPVFDAAAAERHWEATFTLFGETLASAA
jgi:carboxymethylenebutenolidase